jgi:hypothetical protein
VNPWEPIPSLQRWTELEFRIFNNYLNVGEELWDYKPIKDD